MTTGGRDEPTGISINWYAHHRRSEEIARIVGADVRFIRTNHSLLVRRYFAQARSTRRALNDARPAFVIVMQPPPFALMTVIRWARRNSAVVVGDLHSGTFFDSKWRPFLRYVLRQLRRHGFAIVPNTDLALRARAAGVTTFVSHGQLRPVDRCAPSPTSFPGRAFALVPLSYSADEPIQAVLDAAARAPEISWVLTGHAPRNVRSVAPSNVLFAGYLSVDDYRELQRSADVIVALTTQDSTMQSAGYEAMASATPLVITRFDVLTDYFGDAAIYVDNSAAEIAAGVRSAMREQGLWGARMASRRERIVAEQIEAEDEIRAWLRVRIGGSLL